MTSWHEEILDFLGPWFPLSCRGTAAVSRKSQGFLEDVHEIFIEPMAGDSASLANTQGHPLKCIIHSLTHSFTQQILDLLDAKTYYKIFLKFWNGHRISMLSLSDLILGISILPYIFCIHFESVALIRYLLRASLVAQW